MHSARFSLHLCIISLCLSNLNHTSYDRLILDFGHLYLENERDIRRKNEKESVCTLADTGPSVNGWMNLGEKGCLWAADSVAARLINEALARGPEEDQAATPLSGWRANRQIPLPTYLSVHLSINRLLIERRTSLPFVSIVN